jgi:hypothetical protein
MEFWYFAFFSSRVCFVWILLLLYLEIEAVNQISVKNPYLVSLLVSCARKQPLRLRCISQRPPLTFFAPPI